MRIPVKARREWQSFNHPGARIALPNIPLASRIHRGVHPDFDCHIFFHCRRSDYVVRRVYLNELES